jgi:integrase
VREGSHPDTGEFLRPRHGADRVNDDGTKQSKARSLYDLTFSAPKSVSIQAMVGEDERLIAAHDKAVREALAEAENYAATRVRLNGANDDRTTGNWIVAAYRHDTSRELDPQLHTHAYYETDSKGQRKRQSVILGDRNLYTTQTQARKATQALLLRLNGESPGAEVEAASFGALLDRYIEQELSERYSTRKSHLSNIRVHIRPRWGEYPVDKMKPMAMEQWLRELPLAPKSKTHVRGIMHLVFKCAERWGIIELGKNPVSLVRVKNGCKRLKRPRVLDVDQFFELLKYLGEPYRTMVLVAECLGLRVSEILGLQWGDFNFENRSVLVQRSVVGGRVDDVKTEYSRDDVPLDARRQRCCCNGALLQSSRETRIGFLPIPSQGGRTTRRACRSRRSSGLRSSPNWERTLAGTHFATPTAPGSTRRVLR